MFTTGRSEGFKSCIVALQYQGRRILNKIKVYKLKHSQVNIFSLQTTCASSKLNQFETPTQLSA